MGALTVNRKRGNEYYTFDSKLPSSYYSPNVNSGIDLHVSKKPRISSSSSYPNPSPELPISSKSAEIRVSRVYRYPKPVNGFRREVHAPCRVPKLGFSGSSEHNSRPSKEGFAEEVRNILNKYVSAKNSAFKTLRYFKEDKEVIDVDAENHKAEFVEYEHESRNWVKSFRYLKKDKEVIDVYAENHKNDEQVEFVEYEHESSDWVKSFRYVKKDKEVIDIDAENHKNDVSTDLSIEDVQFVDDGSELQETSGVVPILQELDGKVVVEHNFQPSSSSLVSDLTKVDNASISLEQKLEKLELLGLPTHRKLQEIAERRNSKLNSLKFQIELNEKRRAALQLLRPAKRAEEDVLQDVLRQSFLPLTEQEEVEVSWALSNSCRRKVLVTHENSNIEITGELLQCLRPGAWLNDEVINVYLELLKEREKREPKNFLKCHFFNTFFYKKLFYGKNGYDFKSVRRWTTQRKLGYCLRECDKIFVPIHKEIHWCLAVINKKDQKFQYLDSLGGFDTQVLKVLAKYFVDEVKDKGGEPIDISSWEQEHVEDLPEQENGWDCGMFMIKYADFYSRGLGLYFNQEHMPYFRLRTAKEILRLKAE